MTVSRIIEGTITLVILYLVLSNGAAFSGVVRAFGSVYKDSVMVLQGR